MNTWPARNCAPSSPIPLKDPKDAVLGLVKVENKKRGDGPSSESGFDEADESIARILANTISLVLEHLRTDSINRSLVQAIHSIRDRGSMLDQILQCSRALVHADTTFEAVERPGSPGDALVLFSDGIVEAFSQGVPFMDDVTLLVAKL